MVHYPAPLSVSDSKKLAQMLKLTGGKGVVVVACPERTGSGDFGCIVKLAQSDASPAEQMTIEADASLVFRGKLEIAARILRRPAAGILTSQARAECRDASPGLLWISVCRGGAWPVASDDGRPGRGLRLQRGGYPFVLCLALFLANRHPCFDRRKSHLMAGWSHPL
jgi:hypothetical protein